MVSKHYKNQRSKREEFIDEHFGDGHIIDEFIVDRGHPHGAERHCIMDNGVIVINNVVSGKLITKLLSRPYQIKRYYESSDKEPPEEYEKILELAHLHNVLGYNHI